METKVLWKGWEVNWILTGDKVRVENHRCPREEDCEDQSTDPGMDSTTHLLSDFRWSYTHLPNSSPDLQNGDTITNFILCYRVN